LAWKTGFRGEGNGLPATEMLISDRAILRIDR
jgi:hypothetical protein